MGAHIFLGGNLGIYTGNAFPQGAASTPECCALSVLPRTWGLGVPTNGVVGKFFTNYFSKGDNQEEIHSGATRH